MSSRYNYIDLPQPYVTLDVVYFNQLLGAARTQMLVELLFFSRFQPFLFISNLFQYIFYKLDQIL